MKDRLFLIWLHNRVVNVYGESRHMDFLGKLRSIIETIPGDQETPNLGGESVLREVAKVLLD